MRNRLYSAGYLVILVMAAFALHHMWRQHLETRLLVAQGAVEDAAARLESLIEESTGHVAMLRITAESLLRDLATGHQSAGALGHHIHASAGRDAYCSEDARDNHTALISSVSGLGPPPAPGSPLAHEVEMALLLAPQLDATAQNIPNATWIYYTSAQRFIAMYPRVSCTDFFYSDELHAHEFFALGLPERNPGRSQFWTSAYIDEAGKGLMATVGAPVYDGEDRFRGTVAIDLTMSALSNYMVGQELGEGRLLIVNAQRQVIADRSLLAGAVPAAPLVDDVLPHHGEQLDRLVFDEYEGFTADRGALFAARALKGAPWRLVYMVDRGVLYRQAWRDSWVEITGLLLLVLLIAAFETARRKGLQLKTHIVELDAATQAAHKARKEADEANRAKSLMLANVSHDLRTPLNAIIGFSDLMQHELLGPLSARYIAYARDIKASGELLLKIINGLLDLAKVESGQYKLHEEVVDIGDLADKCRRMMADQALNDGIVLEAAVAAGLPLVKADARALQRVLLNLLSNAIKFTRPGGTVTLNAWLDPKFRVTIAVADTGSGISKRDLEHLFRPFSRGESALTANNEGTGLGLSIVKSLVELHDGKVSMESALGVGTNVTVQLPAWRNQRPGTTAPAASPPDEEQDTAAA